MSFWKSLGKETLDIGKKACSNLKETTDNYKEYESYSDEQLEKLSKSWDSKKSFPAKAALAKRRK